jgi:hypothetical protein
MRGTFGMRDATQVMLQQAHQLLQGSGTVAQQLTEQAGNVVSIAHRSQHAVVGCRHDATAGI